LAADLYPRLRLARVEESVHLPDRFTLRFDDPVFAVFDADTFTLGTVIEVAFRTEADPLVVTEGEVTSIAVEPGASGHHELVVVGLDLGHRLARRSRTRTFAHMSDAAIARQIAAEYGLDADVHADGQSHPYVMQAGQTDWAFLRERAGRTGNDVWVTGRTMHVAPQPTAYGAAPTLTWGANLHQFTVRFAAADRCDEVVVHGWDGIGKRPVRGRAGTGEPGSDAPAVQQLAEAARRSFGLERRETGRRGVGSAAEADALAQSLLARVSSSEVLLRGEATGDPRLTAGAEVRLQGVGHRLGGGYRLTSVEHYYASGFPYVTRFVAGTKDPIGLADLLRGGGSAPTVNSVLPLGAALLVGEVTNNDDPDGFGRVRVRFPTLSKEDESAWARIAAPGAGSMRGMQWLPEVGDEVLAGFEFGDIHRPVVLGGLWSRSDPPPEGRASSDGKTATRVLRSRKASGVEIVDDPRTSVAVRLGDADCALTLTEEETSLVGAKRVRLKGDRVEIEANTTLVLRGTKVEISATGDVVVEGKQIRLN
jgi:uncharacterized protein involved in type VI secretion and phage assembly